MYLYFHTAYSIGPPTETFKNGSKPHTAHKLGHVSFIAHAFKTCGDELSFYQVAQARETYVADAAPYSSSG